LGLPKGELFGVLFGEEEPAAFGLPAFRRLKCGLFSALLFDRSLDGCCFPLV